jgi:hypothetical protein
MELTSLDRAQVVADINRVLCGIPIIEGMHRIERDAGNGVTLVVRSLTKKVGWVELVVTIDEDEVIDPEEVFLWLNHISVQLIDPSLPRKDKCLVEKELWPVKGERGRLWVSYQAENLGTLGTLQLV